MRGHRLSLCKRHSLWNIYHSMIKWLPYKRKLSHKSTGPRRTINQSGSHKSAWPSNGPVVKRSRPLFKILTRQCCFVLLSCKQWKHKNPIISHTKKQWYKPNHNIYVFKISHLPIEMLCYSSPTKTYYCARQIIFNPNAKWCDRYLCWFVYYPLGRVKRRHTRKKFTYWV